MLDYLRIQDLALIEDVALDFASGINVLSGETGAGKSFILKAINFITGDKLTAGLVRPGKEKASAEAIFTMPDGSEVVIRRELMADSGRSRVFINDKLSSQEALLELRSALILHTSQHGQQKLLLPAYQNKILDDFMARSDLLAKRDTAVNTLTEVAARKAELEARFAELAGRRELLEFQQQEIDKVDPKEGEEDELEEQRQILRQADTKNAAVEQALMALHGESESTGLLAELAVLERAIKSIAEQDTSFAPDLEAIADIYPTFSDLSSRLRRSTKSSSGGYDAEGIESRLFAIAQLKRKLKRSLPEILAMRDEISENLTFLDSCTLDLKQLAREEKAACDALALILAELNPVRRKAASELKLALEAELRELGFSEDVQVEFAFTPKELYPGRSDCAEETIRIFWMPNPGQTAQPLDKIASGGELSRFLLGLVSLMASRMQEQPVLIFDEVDSGVGGITLNKVADKLRKLGAARQMILISHWPSLAATANRHFFVKKEVIEGETYTRCYRLEGQDVVNEIARMGGGGEQGMALARELINK
ncbi:AAA family ATPase [Desulfovibrio sp. OttesenSCG-928-F07]|nr:AAA family ATPase [Desulfovibrio sp. OttesenSCG-928-F07]